VHLVESSRRSQWISPKSSTNVPGHAGTDGESTQPFDVGALWPSNETHDNRTETTAVDPEASQANDAGELQARDPGVAEVAIESRSRRWKLIATALALIGVAVIGSVFALEGRAPGLPKQPPRVAATDDESTRLKPPNDEIVAASADAGARLTKDTAQSTQITAVKEQPVDLSAQPSLGSAPLPVRAKTDVGAATGVSSATPVAPKVDASAVAAQADPPPAQSPNPLPLRTVSLGPDGTPIATPASSAARSIEASSSAEPPKPPTKSAPEATTTVGTAQPLIPRPDLRTARVVKTVATGPTTDRRGQAHLLGVPARSAEEASVPKSAQAAVEPAATPATPADAARQSFDRVLHTFGDLFGTRTPPAGQPSDPAAASTCTEARRC
jgi:hypothetical protein